MSTKRTYSKSSSRPSKRSKTNKIPMSRLPRALIPETKFHNNSAAVSSNFLLHTILPSQGDDGDAFVGSQLRSKGLDFSFSCAPSSVSTAIRISVFVLKDPTVFPAYIGPITRYDHRQFTIIHDVLFDATMRRTHRANIPLSSVVRFNAAGTAVTDNNIFIAVNADASNVMQISSRFYYYDN